MIFLLVFVPILESTIRSKKLNEQRYSYDAIYLLLLKALLLLTGKELQDESIEAATFLGLGIEKANADDQIETHENATNIEFENILLISTVILVKLRRRYVRHI